MWKQGVRRGSPAPTAVPKKKTVKGFTWVSVHPIHRASTRKRLSGFSEAPRGSGARAHHGGVPRVRGLPVLVWACDGEIFQGPFTLSTPVTGKPGQGAGILRSWEVRPAEKKEMPSCAAQMNDPGRTWDVQEHNLVCYPGD